MRHQRAASEGSEVVSQELFRARLDALIDLSHRLAKLSRVMPWEAIANAVSVVFPPAPVGPGRPALPIRLMAGQCDNGLFRDAYTQRAHHPFS